MRDIYEEILADIENQNLDKVLDFFHDEIYTCLEIHSLTDRCQERIDETQIKEWINKKQTKTEFLDFLSLLAKSPKNMKILVDYLNSDDFLFDFYSRPQEYIQFILYIRGHKFREFELKKGSSISFLQFVPVIFVN